LCRNKDGRGEQEQQDGELLSHSFSFCGGYWKTLTQC
jgi:hypothetical protein